MATVSQSLAFLSNTTSACPLRRTAAPSPHTHRRLAPISCNQNDNSGPPPLMLDRRDVLLSLTGGLYAASATTTALANPLTPPTLSTCHTSNSPGIDPSSDLLKCCPPNTASDIANIGDYTYPKTHLRIRRPAHLVINDEEYMDKYKAAVQAMKDLPADDPWNFIQQAKIHCAFCNGGYSQLTGDVPLQVHGSWFFLPWHRFYLHFYERILGKLIDDDTFALPYWNFDSPDGMTFPAIFTDVGSTLYNPNRNPNHLAPAVLDYQYGYKAGDRPGVTPEQIKQENVAQMRSAFKQSLQLAELFMGDPLRAGEAADASNASGRLESIHNSVHQFVGPVKSPHTDMGNFATAGRDSSFYCLHANVDRLWQVYRNLRGNAVEFTDPDWLDSTFIFYDENRQIVRVKLSDSLNPSKFSYTYEEVPMPWLGKVSRRKTVETKTKQELALVPVTEFGKVPRQLESTIRILVPRPKKSRSKSDKEDKVEVLYIKGIQPTTTGAARFDVYVAKPYGSLAGPDYGDLAGSYVKLPHSVAAEVTSILKGKMKPALLKLGLTSVLEDLGADDEENLVVTIIPRDGDVTIGGVGIKLLQSDSA